MPPRRISSRLTFWLPLLVAAVIALGTSRAHAQVFRPRNPKAITTRTVAVPGAPGAVAGKKPVAAATTPGATAKPAVKANPARRAAVKKKRKPRADDDTVVIDDDEEEEDVKITDD